MRRLAVAPAVAALALAMPSHADAQAWDKLVSEIQMVSLTGTCWSWDQTFADEACSLQDLGVAVGVAYTIATLRRDTAGLGAELVLEVAYGESNPFRMTRDSVELRGVLREQPALAVCAAGGYSDNVALLLCGRTGIVGLHDTRATVETAASPLLQPYDASASIFQLGGRVELVVGFDRLLLSLRYGWTARDFTSVGWEGGAESALPPALPRSLDLSGWGWGVGLVVQVKPLL